MANVQRHSRNRTNPETGTILVTVLAGVTVELGDLIFQNSESNLLYDGSSSADYFAYPFEYFRKSGSSLTLNKDGVTDYFLGIAMDDVDGENTGVNKKITVATEGEFEVDLKPAKTVSVGDLFGASGTTSASNLLNQKVMKVTDDSFSLGRFVERKTHALSALVFIETILK